MAESWVKIADPMQGFMGSGRYRPPHPQRPEIPAEMLPARGLGVSGAVLREVPPVLAPGKVLESTTPATSTPRAPRGRSVPRVTLPAVRLGTIRGTILRAACELAAGSTLARVDIAAVAVRAWRLDPQRFGLRGYEDLHPDANRVYAKLSGADGLVALGLLSRTGFGVVSVTRSGLAWWRQVMP